MSLEFDKYRSTPIRFEYAKPNSSFISSIKRDLSATQLQNLTGIVLDNRYFKAGIKRSIEKMYLRTFVFEQIKKAKEFLEPDFGFVIFDGYRNRHVQANLFDSFSAEINRKHPDWTTEQIYLETRKFVAHPDEPNRFPIPPHNTGGAVDIGLSYKDQLVKMGTDFDDFTEMAYTDYFEQPYNSASKLNSKLWDEIRTNRRMLFHAMASVGFTNWKYEWWHFDMGNCIWAQEFGLDWIYDSMDTLIVDL